MMSPATTVTSPHKPVVTVPFVEPFTSTATTAATTATSSGLSPVAGMFAMSKIRDLDQEAESSIARSSCLNDLFVNRNIFLLTIVNKMNLYHDVSVVSKDSIHMDKVVSIPSSFLLKREDISNSGSSSRRRIEEFGCVFFKTQEEFAFLARRSENGAANDIACQFVVPQHIFDDAIGLGYGRAHPFAGLYHPILKLTVPATLLSIYTPSSKAASDYLMDCIQEAYEFAKEKEEH